MAFVPRVLRASSLYNHPLCVKKLIMGVSCCGLIIPAKLVKTTTSDFEESKKHKTRGIILYMPRAEICFDVCFCFLCFGSWLLRGGRCLLHGCFCSGRTLIGCVAKPQDWVKNDGKENKANGKAFRLAKAF